MALCLFIGTPLIVSLSPPAPSISKLLSIMDSNHYLYQNVYTITTYQDAYMLCYVKKQSVRKCLERPRISPSPAVQVSQSKSEIGSDFDDESERDKECP